MLLAGGALAGLACSLGRSCLGGPRLALGGFPWLLTCLCVLRRRVCVCASVCVCALLGVLVSVLVYAFVCSDNRPSIALYAVNA